MTATTNRATRPSSPSRGSDLKLTATAGALMSPSKILPIRKRSSLSHGGSLHSSRSSSSSSSSHGNSVTFKSPEMIKPRHPATRTMSLPPLAALPFDEYGNSISIAHSGHCAHHAHTNNATSNGCSLQSSNRRRRYQRRGSKCPSMLLMMAAENVRESHLQGSAKNLSNAASTDNNQHADSLGCISHGHSNSHDVPSQQQQQLQQQLQQLKTESPTQTSPKTVMTLNQSRTLTLLTEALNLSCTALEDDIISGQGSPAPVALAHSELGDAAMVE